MVSSFLLHDIPKHDTRLSDVREALLLGFRAYIGGYRKINTVLCLAAPRGDAAHHDHSLVLQADTYIRHITRIRTTWYVCFLLIEEIDTYVSYVFV